MNVRPRFWRFLVALVSAGSAAAAGDVLRAALGYRFPLITFFPAVMFAAWWGGFWPGIVATLASAALVDRLWMAPLRAAGHSTAGDTVALLLFVAIGFLCSTFSESLHRSTARERHARERAEDSERALRETERQLRHALAGEHRARAEAEEANRLKDRFVAMVSHELRTPLNAVLGWADMLKSRMADDALRTRAVESILANAKRQSQIVDDLLDIAGMMSGKLQIRQAPVNVVEIAEAALDLVRPAANAKHVIVSLEAESDVPILNADGMRLQQVFWNLLSNAIKFTPEHGVVRCRLRRVEGALEATITDTGQGIPEHLLTSIFEPFRQADSSPTRVQRGLGLGLTIVKYLVEAHGGSVVAESAGTGRGSTFRVRLPLVTTSETAITPALAQLTETATRQESTPARIA